MARHASRRLLGRLRRPAWGHLQSYYSRNYSPHLGYGYYSPYYSSYITPRTTTTWLPTRAATGALFRRLWLRATIASGGVAGPSFGGPHVGLLAPGAQQRRAPRRPARCES